MAKKRGRKPKNNYFGENEEKAVVDFLVATTQDERDKIYRERLMAPLNKMIDSIIRKYKLYRKNVSFEDLHADVLSYLITKSSKFKPDKGKKAYSYYGTICKHYLLYLLQQDDKLKIRNISYEDIYKNIEEDEKYSYELDYGESRTSILLREISEEIKKEVEIKVNSECKKKITENEIKVGRALVKILENWEPLFEDVGGTNKYTKNTFYSIVREYTRLESKEIRNALVKYKKIYGVLKDDSMDM
jgi:hypothetical protein